MAEPDFDEMDDDAALAGTAPTLRLRMLEALKPLRQHITHEPEWNEQSPAEFDAMLAEADAAIAEAEGKANVRP